MATLNALSMPVTLDGVGVQPYTPVSAIASATGWDRKQVLSVAKRLKIYPAMGGTTQDGEGRYVRADVVRLLLLAQLQQLLGEKSAIPFQLVETAAPAIDRLLQRPDEATVLTLHRGGALNLHVTVPGLAQLLGSASA